MSVGPGWFEAHFSCVTQIIQDFRATVYKAVASMGQEEDFYTMVRTHNKVELLHEENAEYRGERRGFWPSQWKRKKI